jgi:hypothetical protein
MTRNRWGLWVLLGLLSATSMLAVPSLAGAAAWGPEFSVSGPMVEDAGPFDPALAIDAEGNATYVWSEDLPTSGRTVLRSRVVSANGAVGPVEEITTTADPGDSYEPRVDVDGSGRVHVAWKQEQWSCSGVCSFAQEVKTVALDPQGAPIGEPVEVVGYPAAQSSLSNLSFAVNSDGTAALVFTYIANSPATESVVAYVVSAAGVVTEISPTGAASPVGPTGIAINASGQIFAAWAAYDETSGINIEGAVLGGATAEAQILNSGGTYAGMDQLGAMIDGAGNGTAVYSAQPPGSLAQVYAARLNGDESVPGPVLISDEASSEWAEVWPDSAAVRGDGSILVSWSLGSDSWVTPLSPSGTLGTPVELTPGEATGWSPHLGLGPGGDGVVLLESSTEVEPGVFTPQLDQVPIGADGQPSGPTSIVARLLRPGSESRFDSWASGVAVSASGNAAAAWLENDESVEGSELRGALRDGVAPSVSLWVPAKALAGEPTVMAASGEDANPISYSWSFGDGSTGTGSVASHAYAAPGTYAVNVTATDSAGNSSSRQASIQVVAAGSGTGVASVRPETKVLKAPPKKARKRTVEVKFVASEASSKFECALDAAGWKPCKSPLKLKGLQPGAHKLKLRATSPSGVVEAGGPVLKFRVLKPKNHG